MKSARRMTNDEIQMTKETPMTKSKNNAVGGLFRISDFFCHSSLVIRHCSLIRHSSFGFLSVTTPSPRASNQTQAV